MNLLLCRLLLIATLIATSSATAQAGNVQAEPAAGGDPRSAARDLARRQLELTRGEKTLITRPDRQRPAHPITLPLFGRPLTLGGRLTVLGRYDHSKLLDFDYTDLDNRDIDGDGDLTEIEDVARGKTPRDDQLRFNMGMQADLFYPITPQLSFYAEMRAFYRSLVWADQTATNDLWLIQRGELWLYAGRILDTPLGLQVGRQRYFDEREWWWDENLDSLRIRFDWPTFHAQIGLAKELLPVLLDGNGIEPEDEDVVRILGVARWQWAKRQELGLYFLHAQDGSSHQPLIVSRPHPTLPCVPDDELPANVPPDLREFLQSGCPPPVPLAGFEDDSDADLTWVGISSSGRIKARGLGRFDYWLDVAGLWGRERLTDYSGPRGQRVVGAVDRHTVGGFGIDVGATWQLPLPLRPYLTAGFAYGSGNPGMTENSDTGFRQTGMQDNNDRFRGVVSFRYYGELLSPELSNLQVVTLGLGTRFLSRSSIDFLYHRYRQPHAAPFLRDVDFKRDPTGLDGDIGEEWDLIVGIENFQPVEFKLVGAIFRTGRAFAPEQGQLSYLASLRIRFNF